MSCRSGFSRECGAQLKPRCSRLKPLLQPTVIPMYLIAGLMIYANSGADQKRPRHPAARSQITAAHAILRCTGKLLLDGETAQEAGYNQKEVSVIKLPRLESVQIQKLQNDETAMKSLKKLVTKPWKAIRQLQNIYSREISVFYWRGANDLNFGDQLNIDLFKYYGFCPLHSTPGQAEVFAIGSILHFYLDRYDAIIIGSGHIQQPATKITRQGRILALRGPKTNFYEGQKNVPLCDPGILAKKIYGEFEKKWRYGIVPHFRDQDDPNLKQFIADNKDVKLIDVLRAPSIVSREIAECEMIFSSSLHGLVIADSYNIPATWINFADRQTGGEFKFSDYHESLGIRRDRITVHKGTSAQKLGEYAATASRPVTESKMNELDAVFKTLRHHLARLRLRRLMKAVAG